VDRVDIWRERGGRVAGRRAEQAAWLLAAAGACLFFALPFLLVAYFHADCLPCGNESLAYRYFACERIQHGEGGSVWLPQGQLLGVVQHVIFFIVRRTVGGAGDEFQRSANLFAAGTTLANVLLMSALFVTVGLSRALRRADKVLIFFAGLTPLYGTRTAGFYFSIVPEYLHLDMVLVPVTVAFFLWQLRLPPPGSRWALSAALGAWVGLLVANKVTLVTIGLVALLPALLSEPLDLLRLTGRLLAAGLSAALSFFGTLFAFYLFRPAPLIEMFPRWVHFALHAGAEPDFWGDGFWLCFRHFQYGYVVAFWPLAALAALAVALRGRDRRWPRAVTALLNLATGAGCAYCLLKRPAATTFFEVTVLSVGLSAMALGTIAGSRVGKGLILLAAAGSITLGVVTFPWQENVATIARSGSRAEVRWRVHRDILRIANGRRIVVIFPDNSYHHEGVHEFLLKGASDFPSWVISERGQRLINTFAPGMVFRYEGGVPPPDSEFPKGALVVWFDRPDLPPLTERYRSLKAVASAAGADQQVWAIRQPDGQVQMWVRACLVR
jgi:hypothetical protein